jgi:2-aminoadipate transaminase
VDETPLALRQFEPRPGIIDMGWGHPSPDLLPVEGLKQAAARVLETYGADALAYGTPAGPGPLIAWICDRLRSIDARAPTPDSIVLSAGNSHALDQIATLITAPGDVVLVEAPTYHLAVRIFRDHPVDVLGVPTDRSGLLLNELTDTCRRLRRQQRSVRLLYTIPTFHNPTGTCLADDRRRELVEIAEAEGLLIIEDDAYRELTYGGVAPPSLWSLAPPGTVVRLGSFSKSLAPGLRAGFIVSDPIITSRIRHSGVLDSGGGISHFSSLVVAEFAASGEFVRHVARLQAAYTDRRDAMLSALSKHLEGRAQWTHPKGGYFIWLTLRDTDDTAALLPKVEAQGASYLPGTTFYLDGVEGTSSMRLAFSRYGPDELVEGVRRIASTIAAASVR